MGNLINPLGGRVNLINFWRHTWPIFYQYKNQDLYHQLAIHIRVLFHCFFRKAVNLRKKKKYGIQVGLLHGLVIKIISNLWGFNNENLTIFLNFYDYGATVGLTKALPNRFFVKRLFSGLFVLREMRKMLRLMPVLSSFEERKINRDGPSKHLFLFTLGFLSKLERSLFGSKAYKYKGCVKPLFSVSLQKFIRRTFFSLKRVLFFRLRVWHVSLILFTKPYLFYLCKLFCIKKCFVFTSISKSSVSATMITRYLVAKCQQGFSVSFVLTTIRRILRYFIPDSYGYKLCVSGRFTRKQIATYRWFKNGMLSLNTLDAGVEYAQDSGFSKFGIFGVKLWVFSITNPQHEE